MRSKGLGLMVIGVLMILFVSFGVSRAQVPTQLIVVTGMDGSLYKMTCEGSSCSGWSPITGRFAAQPTLIWDPALGKYILLGVGLDTAIWKSTFDILGKHNNDWVQLPGGTFYPVAAAGGPTVFGWARIRADGTVASCFFCNPAGTTRIGTGIYQVDFWGSIVGVPRSATIDDLSTGTELGEIGVADRFGVPTAVWVNTNNGATGVAEDHSFVLVLYNY